ncbi:MAG: hypothetical protein OEU92_30755 [Alphaproteobacteria bacterium]|nr:hypothetical protein [Alphaproteobacteria bacterium]
MREQHGDIAQRVVHELGHLGKTRLAAGSEYIADIGIEILLKGGTLWRQLLGVRRLILDNIGVGVGGCQNDTLADLPIGTGCCRAETAIWLRRGYLLNAAGTACKNVRWDIELLSGDKAAWHLNTFVLGQLSCTTNESQSRHRDVQQRHDPVSRHREIPPIAVSAR